MAMSRSIATLTLAIGWLAVSALVTVAQSPDPGPSPAGDPAALETVHGWPGTRAAPAGLYSWPVSAGSRSWMHKVPGTWTDAAPNSVEVTLYATTSPDPPTLQSHALLRAWENGPIDQTAQRRSEVRTEMWLLDVDGTRVTILIDSFPDTDPALLAEARAVVESIVVEPTQSGQRIVFRLLEGWDSG